MKRRDKRAVKAERRQWTWAEWAGVAYAALLILSMVLVFYLMIRYHWSGYGD